MSESQQVVPQFNLILSRLRKNISKKQVADFLEIHPDTYHKKESGLNPFKHTEMKKLSEFFGVTMDVLFLPNKVGDTEFLTYIKCERGTLNAS